MERRDRDGRLLHSHEYDKGNRYEYLRVAGGKRLRFTSKTLEGLRQKESAYISNTFFGNKEENEMENDSREIKRENETETGVQVFSSEEFGEVRTVMRDGEPWFVAADVCRALEIDTTATRRLDDDEKAPLRLTQTSSNGTTQGRDVVVVSESGLYSLVLGSRKPEAKAFKRWITHDVIPSIRKTGGYVSNSEMFVDTYFSGIPDAAKLVLKTALDENLRLQKENEIMKPKYEYCSEVLQSRNAITVSQIAKEYGMSAQKFNQLLKGYKIQYQRRGQWLIRAGLADKGYTDTYTYPVKGPKTARIQTLWTQAGREYLYRFLKKKGIVPVSERNAALVSAANA